MYVHVKVIVVFVNFTVVCVPQIARQNVKFKSKKCEKVKKVAQNCIPEHEKNFSLWPCALSIISSEQ